MLALLNKLNLTQWSKCVLLVHLRSIFFSTTMHTSVGAFSYLSNVTKQSSCTFKSKLSAEKFQSICIDTLLVRVGLLRISILSIRGGHMKNVNFFASIQKAHEWSREPRRERTIMKFSYAPHRSKIEVFPYGKTTL